MIFKLANPNRFIRHTEKISPVLSFLSSILIAYGLFLCFFNSPPDYLQGETVRIMYVHVPCAWFSLMFYSCIAFCSFFSLIFKHTLADIISRALAPIGASLTLATLLTGSIWGKPTWGTWWVWDARLTSELVLFFLYIGYISLFKSIESFKKADQVCAYIAIFGTINIPIIYFSVKWWATLHQGASLSFDGGSQIDSVMLTSLLIMTFAFWFYCIAVILYRAKTIVIYRESQKSWLKKDILNAS